LERGAFGKKGNMNLFFLKKKPIEPAAHRSFAHHQILVEENGKTQLLAAAEIEKKFGIRYLPRLDFPAFSDFSLISRKLAQYRNKGLLDQKQIWLGAYFQKDIFSPEIPPVRLRLIDHDVGWGVFAEKDLKPMTFIGEYAGCVRRKKRADAKNPYCFQYSIVCDESTRFTIDAREQGGIVRFINHSFHPNLMSALATHQNLCHVVLFVHRPISKGEQLCYDYGQDYWAKRSKPKVF
jgi:hypothetical protein